MKEFKSYEPTKFVLPRRRDSKGRLRSCLNTIEFLNFLKPIAKKHELNTEGVAEWQILDDLKAQGYSIEGLMRQFYGTYYPDCRIENPQL